MRKKIIERTLNSSLIKIKDSENYILKWSCGYYFKEINLNKENKLRKVMKYVNRISIDLPSFREIQLSGDFELGDLTIFIGKCNAGKTRIMENMANKIREMFSDSKVVSRNSEVQFREECNRKGLFLSDYNIKKNLKVGFVTSPRYRTDKIDGLGRKLAKSVETLRAIDPLIEDFGTNVLKFSDEQIRPLVEQGSGVHSQVHLLDKLHDPNQLIFIDEPEISQFPYGKIEILNAIVGELKNKQVIFATHDPTMINQYLIKKIMNNKNYKIIIYSFCGGKFEKVDFDNNLDPESHVGYLSQTYSGKPVHLVFEGQTEFYAFQALLTQYCIHNNISYFPKFLNKISLSYMAGGQWKINIHHLPPPAYYNVLVILDGEYSNDVKSLPSEKYNLMNSFDEISDEKINVITLKSENFDRVFKKFFGEEFEKPLKLSEEIWNLNEEKFKELINSSDKDIDLIRNVIEWSLAKAGFNLERNSLEKFI